MTDMFKYADYIRTALTRRELLEQMAEEDIEHGKAALKLIRAEGLSSNGTPKTVSEAQNDFNEEAMDVLTVLYLLGFNELWFVVAHYWKWERWAKRLGYVEPTPEPPKKKRGRPPKKKEMTVEELEAMREDIKTQYKTGKLKSVDAVTQLKLNAEAIQKAKRGKKRKGDDNLDD